MDEVWIAYVMNQNSRNSCQTLPCKETQLPDYRQHQAGLGAVYVIGVGDMAVTFKSAIFKLIVQNSNFGTLCDITLRWKPQKSPSV